MRILAAAVAFMLALSAPTARAQSPMSAQDRLLESLRRELTDKLQATGRFSSIAAPEKATLKAKTLDGAELTINIDNLSAEVRTKPAQRGEIVGRFVRTIEAATAPSTDKPEPTATEFLASLRPVVRPQAFIDAAMSQTSNDPSTALLSWPLAGEANVLVAIDGSEHVRMVTADAANRHKLKPDEIIARALNNVRGFAATLKIEVSEPFRALSVEEDYYSAAMLLLPEAMRELEKDLGADFVVLLPDRNRVVAARARDAGALQTLGERIAQQRRAPPLIAHLLQRSGTDWKRFTIR